MESFILISVGMNCVPFCYQEMEIKKMAKTGNREACKILAKQLVQLRKQKNLTYAVSSKVTSMSTQTKVMNSQMKMAGAMSSSAKVRGTSEITYTVPLALL